MDTWVTASCPGLRGTGFSSNCKDLVLVVPVRSLAPNRDQVVCGSITRRIYVHHETNSRLNIASHLHSDKVTLVKHHSKALICLMRHEVEDIPQLASFSISPIQSV